MNIAKKINESGKTITILSVVVCIFMFVLNYMTPMIGDDYTYCYSFADGKRITTVLHIIPSMMEHYKFMNGKVIVHGLVQILLMLPQVVFDILNSVMACLLCYVIYSYVWKMWHSLHNAVLYSFVIASLWLFMPSFGNVFLWLSGSINYLWCLTFILLYMKPLYFGFSKGHTKGFRIIYIFSGFIIGMLSESISFAVLGYFILWIVYKRFFKVEAIEFWKLLPIVTIMCGYSIILLSPATQNKKIRVNRDILKALLSYSKFYFYTFKILLIFGCIMAAILLLFGLEKERLLKVAVWVFLSFGMNSMLSIAAYHSGRSSAGVSVFLIIADGILLSLIFDHTNQCLQNNWNMGATWMCRIFIGYSCLFLLYQLICTVPLGFQDIHESHVRILEDVNYIRKEVENGEEDILVPTITSSSRYSALYQLSFVDAQYDTLPNKSMAKYYGARRIYGSD